MVFTSTSRGFNRTMDSVLKNCNDMINSHDNYELDSYINKNTEIIVDIIEECDYASLYATACKSRNHECVPVLVKYGMGPKNITGDNDDEWDVWGCSPLRKAFSNVDVEMIETLMHAGFKTGHQSSCPDCRECGWPQICLFETLFSKEKIDNITDDILERIIRVSDWSHVLSTYEKNVSDHFGKTDIDKPRMDRILGVICKTIPGIKISGLCITNRNVGHVMDMVYSNIVNIDDLLMETIKNLLRCRYKTRRDLLDVKYAEKCMKDLIDYGADITIPFVADYIMYTTDLPKKKDTYGEYDYPYGSFEDLVQGVINKKEENLRKCLTCPMWEAKKVIKVLEKVYSHIKFKKREVFLKKRVDKFKGNENLDMVSKNFLEMDSPMFSNVMKYMV